MRYTMGEVLPGLLAVLRMAARNWSSGRHVLPPWLATKEDLRQEAICRGLERCGDVDEAFAYAKAVLHWYKEDSRHCARRELHLSRVAAVVFGGFSPIEVDDQDEEGQAPSCIEEADLSPLTPKEKRFLRGLVAYLRREWENKVEGQVDLYCAEIGLSKEAGYQKLTRIRRKIRASKKQRD